jgi:hypothetical protein
MLDLRLFSRGQGGDREWHPSPRGLVLPADQLAELERGVPLLRPVTTVHRSPGYTVCPDSTVVFGAATVTAVTGLLAAALAGEGGADVLARVIRPAIGGPSGRTERVLMPGADAALPEGLDV